MSSNHSIPATIIGLVLFAGLGGFSLMILPVAGLAATCPTIVPAGQTFLCSTTPASTASWTQASSPTGPETVVCSSSSSCTFTAPAEGVTYIRAYVGSSCIGTCPYSVRVAVNNRVAGEFVTVDKLALIVPYIAVAFFGIAVFLAITYRRRNHQTVRLN